MTADRLALATRTMKARRQTTCPACRGDAVRLRRALALDAISQAAADSEPDGSQ